MKSKSPYGYIKETTEYPKWKLILKRKWTIVAVTLGMLLISAAFTFLQEKTYKATAVINFNDESIRKYLIAGKSGLETEVKTLTSDQFLTEIAKQVLDRKFIDKNAKADLLPVVKEVLDLKGKNRRITYIKNKLKSNLRYKIDLANNSIFISFLSSDPGESEVITNLFAKEIHKRSLLNSKANIVPLAKILEKKKEEKQSDLSKSELALQQLNGNVPELSSSEKILINKLAELESELEITDLQIKMYGIVLKNYQKELKKLIPDKADALVTITDPDIINLQDQIEKTEAKGVVQEVMKIYPGFKPSLSWQDFQVEDVNALKTKLDSLIRDYTYNNLKSGKSTSKVKNLIFQFVQKTQSVEMELAKDDLVESIIYDALTELEPQYQKINFEKKNLARLTREYTFNSKLMGKIDNLLNKFKKEESNSIAAIEYIDYAETPSSFFKPNIFLNLLFGGLLGLIIGLIAAYRLSLFATHVKDAGDLEVLGYRIISTVPHFSKNRSMLIDASRKNNGDGFMDENGNEEYDSFQRIYAYLRYGFLDREIKSVMITSSIKEEGKSLVASNLAIMLAAHGHKVLLVDANLKSPAVHKFFNLKSKPSLAHYLFRKEELENCIKETHVEGLKVITGIEFPQDPSVVLTSERMKKFVNSVYPKFDYIIYDTPDVLSLEEVGYLAGMVDEVIMVARFNRTKISELKQADKIFNGYDVTPGGFVLNDLQAASSKSKSNNNDKLNKLPKRSDHYKRFQKNVPPKVTPPKID